MEIKHYRLFKSCFEEDLLYTYVRIGRKEIYFEKEKWLKMKKMCILLLTLASVFAIDRM